MAASSPRGDVKEEKKGAKTEAKNEVDMKKVFADGARAVGYLAESKAGGRPSQAYNFSSTPAGHEFKKLQDELIASAGDSKALLHNDKIAVADKVSELERIVKMGALAAVDGDQKLFEQKEREAKTAYEQLNLLVEKKGLEDEKKKIEGLEKRVAEAERVDLARTTEAYHQRAREHYLREKFRTKGVLSYEAELRAGHHDRWETRGDPNPIKLGDDTKAGAISVLTAKGSDAKPGVYYNTAKNYTVEIEEERDRKGALTGRIKASPSPPIPAILWGNDYLLDSIVGRLMGGKDRYEREFRDQTQAMISLLKPKNKLEEVKGEKQLKGDAGYIMDSPNTTALQKAGVPLSLSYHQLLWTFEEVKKVKPPIAFRGEKGMLTYLHSQVDNGPFSKGWDAFKPGDRKRNIAMLKNLENEIANHNAFVQQELVKHEKIGEQAGKEKVETAESEQKYLEGLEAKGKGTPLSDAEKKEVAAVVAIEEKKEAADKKRPLLPEEKNALTAAAERKIHIEHGARVEMKEMANSPHIVRINQAKQELNAAMSHAGNFVAGLSKSAAPPPKWAACFTPPADKAAWAAAVDAPADSKEVATYLDFCGKEIERLDRTYADACGAWKNAHPGGAADFEAHHKLWVRELGATKADAIMKTEARFNAGLYMADRLDADKKKMNERVQAITTKPDITDLKGTTPLKGESPIRISQEIAKLNNQLTVMNDLDVKLQTKLLEIDSYRYDPEKDNLEGFNHSYDPSKHKLDEFKKSSHLHPLQEMRGQAHELAAEIKRLAVAVDETYKSYEKNKKAWKDIPGDFNEKIRALDSRKESDIEGAHDKLEVSPRGVHIAGRHYATRIDGVYHDKYHDMVQQLERHRIDAPLSPSASSDSSVEEKVRLKEFGDSRERDKGRTRRSPGRSSGGE